MTIGPASWNHFVIYKGGTFDESLPWIDGTGNPVNLSGYSADMRIRGSVEDSTPLVTLTTGSGITLGGTAGTIRLRIEVAQTTNLPECEAVYDLRMTSPAGDRYFLLAGSIHIAEMVTR